MDVFLVFYFEILLLFGSNSENFRSTADKIAASLEDIVQPSAKKVFRVISAI